MNLEQILAADPAALPDDVLMHVDSEQLVAAMDYAGQHAYDAPGARTATNAARDVFAQRMRNLEAYAATAPYGRVAQIHSMLCSFARSRLLIQATQAYLAISATAAKIPKATPATGARPGDPLLQPRVDWPAFGDLIPLPIAPLEPPAPARFDVNAFLDDRADYFADRLRVIPEPNGRLHLHARAMSDADTEVLSTWEGAAILWVQAQFPRVRPASMDVTI